MRKLAPAALALLLLISAGPTTAEPAQGDPPQVTTDRGEAGELLRRWYAEGTAAGHLGDLYDNRDGGHSRLDLARFPQLRARPYTAADREARRDWALQTAVVPGVVLGNSSTSGGPRRNGSNPRTAYAVPELLAILERQYRGNNLYVYPEHRDHDPIAAGGLGDLFPTNTPYLIVSQGSSGSDRAFLRAIALTLASFRPEVKGRLVREGLLMPAVQTILRRSYVDGDDKAYLSGAAHPTAFDGTRVDAVAMMRMAHALEPDALPPLVRLRLVAGATARPGVDYFDTPPTEIHATTDGVIAHVFRGLTRSRRLVVSAEDSFDPDGRPLRFEWVLLRGDPEAVRIRPLDARGSRAEIEILWHPRRPVAPGAALHSSRVDVGVFASNGVHHSAPAFVTSYAIPSEARTYGPGGELLEVGYGLGTNRFEVHDWSALFEVLLAAGTAPVIDTVLEPLGVRGRETLAELAGAWDEAEERVLAARRAAEAAAAGEGDGEEAARAHREARKRIREAEAARDALLAAPVPGAEAGIEAFLDARLHTVAAEHDFLRRWQIDLQAPSLRKEADALVGLGVARRDGRSLDYVPLHPERSGRDGFSAWQRHRIEALHGIALAEVLAGVEHRREPFHVDGRIAGYRDWRDLYTGAGDLPPGGWRRFGDGKPAEFTVQGLAVLDRDRAGRVRTAVRVEYGARDGASPSRPGERSLVTWRVDPSRRFEYVYEGPSDQVGWPVPLP